VGEGDAVAEARESQGGLMSEPHITARQIKAARALLDWSQDDLAASSGLSVATIRKLELGHISPRGKTTESIRHAFEDGGLEFIHPNGVRQRPEDIRVYQGCEGAKEFFDDVYETAKKKNCEIILVHPSAQKYLSTVLGDYRAHHTERMVALKRDKPFVKCILTEDTGPLWASEYGEYRWISKSYVDSVPFYVYDDKYAIIVSDTDPSPRITVIQSHIIAEAFRHQFYSMWEKATPLNKVERSAPLKKRA
jgi:transcriptional regulator with XRE-family HTH domain